ncbi:MAG: ribonuclease [Rubritepida sp.]|nr:ribonuclease [Rubritepida sp.]
MASRIVTVAKDTINGFLEDEALTRAAAIAYFALFSLGPLLFLITGICGLVFGEEQVRKALAEQMRGLLGQDAAGTLDGMAQGALGGAQGGLAVALGIGTLALTASGAFGALQAALNAIWKTEMKTPDTATAAITHFVRAKALSLGLVGTTGFLLLVSLAVSAAVSSFQLWLHDRMPGLEILLAVVNFVVSLGFITLLFAAVYKILPDRRLHWHDVMIGAFVTALLFSFGKLAIGIYIGSSDAARGFGAAGTLAIVLLWLYYSAVIFLLGAEFTRAWSGKAPAVAPPTVILVPVPSTEPRRARRTGAIRKDDSDEVQAIFIMAAVAGLAALMSRGPAVKTR